MKLSEKGYLKIGNRIVGWLENGVAKVTFDPDKIEFDQDDFEGTVCLTLDEAKRVQSALYELLRNSNDKNSREWLTYWMINGRVEQAEGK